jgi:glycosyltransferase involved in cell wall biosynthesis
MTRHQDQVDEDSVQDRLINVCPDPATQGVGRNDFLPLPAVEKRSEGGLRLKGMRRRLLPDTPLVTIITVVYNGERHLEQAIMSVLGQQYRNIEYIVVDGGSTDRTLEIVEKYEDAIDYWVSARDRGIYHAMNRGISLAQGEIIGLVNSDDYLLPWALQKVVACFACEPKPGYVYGAVDLVRQDGSVFGRSTPLPHGIAKERIYREMPYPHLACFVSADVYRRVGLFNEQYRLRADYDFAIRLMKSGIRGKRINAVLGAFREGGQSGGIGTYIETRKLLLAHEVPRLKVEVGFYASLLKMWLAGVLPLVVTRMLKRFRISKHELF